MFVRLVIMSVPKLVRTLVPDVTALVHLVVLHAAKRVRYHVELHVTRYAVRLVIFLVILRQVTLRSMINI